MAGKSLKDVIEIILKGKDQGATKKISGVNKALGSLGKVAGIAGGAVVAGMALAGGALAKMALDATPIPGITKAFEGLTATVEGGSDAMMSALQGASLGMVTNTDLMKQYNLASQLVGESFAKDLPNAMGYLTKVASATGEDMGYMMDSLVRGVGRLSPMILDNLGIQVSLTDAYDDYAESLGISTDEMTKAQQQEALMAQVMAKLEENTASMPEVLGSVDQQWASIKTTFANLKDEIGVALLPALQTLLSALSALWSEHGPAVMAFFNEQLVPAIQILSGVIASLINGEGLSMVKEILGDLIPPQLIEMMTQVGDFIKAVFGPTFEMLFGMLKEKGPGALASVTSWFSDKLLPALQAVWDFLYVDMMPVWMALGELLSVTIGTALKIVAGIWQNVLRPALQEMWTWIQDKIMPLFKKWLDRMGGIQGIIQKITDKIKGLTDKLKGLKLPDWMTPGSPTPWEIGLEGVYASMKKLTNSGLPAMEHKLSALPSPISGGASGGLSGAGAGGGVVVLEYKPQISLASQEEVQRILYPFIQKGLREVQRG